MLFRPQSKTIRCRLGAGGRRLFLSDPESAVPELPTGALENNPAARAQEGSDASAGAKAPFLAARWPGKIDSLLSSPWLAPMLTISGVALGKDSLVETPLLAAPVHASFLCALVGEKNGRLGDWVDRLAQPLQEEQDGRLAALGNLRAKDLQAQITAIEEEREAFFGDAPVRDRHAAASFQERIGELDMLLRPALIVEDPPPHRLEAVAARGRGSLLVVYNEDRLSDPNKIRSELEILVRAWHRKTPQTRLWRETASAPPIRPLLGGLFHLSPTSLARLACSSEPVFRQFFDRLLICAPSPEGAKLAIPSCWFETLARLLANSGQQRCRSLTAAAAARLAQETDPAELAPSEQGRWRGQFPVLATKIGHVVQAWVDDSAEQVCDEAMEIAVIKAKEIVRQSLSTANRCVAADPSGGADEEERRLAGKLQVHGPLSDGALQRHYKKIPIQRLREMLARARQKGQVRCREDGRWEAVRRPDGGAHEWRRS
jgi:hypothetical protein